MIDGCLMAEELDQCNHTVELEVAQFTFSRFLPISSASSEAGREPPETGSSWYLATLAEH